MSVQESVHIVLDQTKSSRDITNRRMCSREYHQTLLSFGVARQPYIETRVRSTLEKRDALSWVDTAGSPYMMPMAPLPSVPKKGCSPGELQVSPSVPGDGLKWRVSTAPVLPAGEHLSSRACVLLRRSSSTPTVPLSGSDLLYGGGGGGDGGAAGGGSSSSRAHAGGQHGGEEVGEVGAWDPRPASRDKQQRLKELDLHGNKRPPSRNTANNRKGTGFDKVPFDREREELRPLGHPLGPAKQSPLRANGIKNNLLRADQFLPQRSNGREEDLVAMGTIWSPSHLQTRGSGTATTTSSSGKSTSAPTTNSGGSAGGGAGGGGSGGTLPGRRPVNLSTSTSTRQLLHHQSGSGTGGASFGGPGGSGMGNGGVRAAKEVEPKYSDPLSGASPTFQQRLMELAALEAETVRWERSKKIKKKPKQDRDS